MKKTMFILFILAYLQAFAQGDSKNKDMRTLHDRKSLGFYFAGTAGFSQIDMNDALTIGGRAAFIFNHSTAVGLAGYGFLNNLDGYNLPVGGMNWYSLAGGYGGVFIEPVVGSSRPLHVALPVLFGMGGAGLVRHTGKGTWDDHFEVELPETDLFFIVEPAIDLELNLTSFFRLAVTISYRFTSDVNLTGKAPDALQGVNVGLTFKLGKF